MSRNYIPKFKLHAQTTYLPVYKLNPCISQPHILKPKNEFFLFLGNNFLEKLTLYLKFFSQVPYGYTKKIVLNFFYLSF